MTDSAPEARKDRRLTLRTRLARLRSGLSPSGSLDPPSILNVCPGCTPNVEVISPGPLCCQQTEEGGVSVALQEVQLRSHLHPIAQAVDQQNARDHQLDRVHDKATALFPLPVGSHHREHARSL